MVVGCVTQLCIPRIGYPCCTRSINIEILTGTVIISSSGNCQCRDDIMFKTAYALKLSKKK